MKKLIFVGLLVVASVALAATAFADRGKGNGGNNFKASLTGFQETPSESTPGHGDFRARISGSEIRYRLHYEGFEAADGAVTAAHIHFGQRGVAGGVSAFLCGGGGKPACTSPEGTFEGVIVAANVVGPTGQGIAPGEIAELIRAMRAGYTYANVHTTLKTAGLIRGQIDHGKRHGHR
jgi:CHRD domain